MSCPQAAVSTGGAHLVRTSTGNNSSKGQIAAEQAQSLVTNSRDVTAKHEESTANAMAAPAAAAAMRKERRSGACWIVQEAEVCATGRRQAGWLAKSRLELHAQRRLR